VAGCVDGFQLELSSFANQTLARQHGQYALMWRVMSTMLSANKLPVVPNLAEPFILALNHSFHNHRRYKERMLLYMAENVSTTLAHANITICVMQHVFLDIACISVMLVYLHNQCCMPANACLHLRWLLAKAFAVWKAYHTLFSPSKQVSVAAVAFLPKCNECLVCSIDDVEAVSADALLCPLDCRIISRVQMHGRQQ